jgi:hypothetical protein
MRRQHATEKPLGRGIMNQPEQRSRVPLQDHRGDTLLHTAVKVNANGENLSLHYLEAELEEADAKRPPRRGKRALAEESDSEHSKVTYKKKLKVGGKIALGTKDYRYRKDRNDSDLYSKSSARYSPPPKSTSFDNLPALFERRRAHTSTSDSEKSPKRWKARRNMGFGGYGREMEELSPEEGDDDEDENIHRGNSSGLSSVPTSPAGTRRSSLSKPWESDYEDDELQDTDIEEGAEDMEKQIPAAMRKRTLSKGKEKAMMNKDKDKPTRLNNSTVPLPRILPNGIQSSIDRLRAIRGESPGKRPQKSETPPRDAQDSDLEIDLKMELEKALQAGLEELSSGDESAEEPEVEEYGSFMEESASGRSTKDHVRTPGAASSPT